MKVLILFLFCSGVQAFTEYPNKIFSTKSNLPASNIQWITTDNVQEACNKESSKRGNQPFSYQVEACSFWNNSSSKNECTIITSKNTTLATLGHEVRHCFQGNWHK